MSRGGPSSFLLHRAFPTTHPLHADAPAVANGSIAATRKLTGAPTGSASTEEVFDRLWTVRTVVDGIGTEWPGPFAADNAGDADRRQGVRLNAPAPETPDDTANGLIVEWASAHPRTGYGSIARLAMAGDERARFLLRRNAEMNPRTIYGYVRDALGEDLAKAAFEGAQAPMDLLNPYKGRGHAFAYPAFETTDDADEPRRPEAIEGITLSGPAGDLVLSDAMVEALDLRPDRVTATGVASSRFTVLVRAYLATFPRAFWGDARAATRFLGITTDYDVILDTDAFEHILGELPQHASAGPDGYDAAWRVNHQDRSEAYQSLARALTARDASLFVPGPSNLDWRVHARFAPEG